MSTKVEVLICIVTFVSGVALANGYMAATKKKMQAQVVAEPTSQPVIPVFEPVMDKPARPHVSVFVCQQRVDNCKLRCRHTYGGYVGGAEQVAGCSRACVERGCSNR